MATFTAKKLDLTQVNGGQEYEQGDFLQSDTINDVVEGTAYAQNVAEAANTTSNNAVSTANSANNTANAASAKVDTFDQRITTAQNTADTAVSNAATAQNTADSATTEINKIKNGTTVVPNANHANNADNANLATKAQQDVNGNPINTTYATREFVTEQQGTRVKVNNANVAELSFTSDPQTQIDEAQSNINNIIDGSQTVGKATRDANGNVIDTTYANLSQVVRVDATQSLTDEQKQQARQNINALGFIGEENPDNALLSNRVRQYFVQNATTGNPTSGSGWLLSGGSGSQNYGAQLYLDDANNLMFRSKSNSWRGWEKVFKTDPSKLAPSTANGWTQTTTTGTLPSAGVYMVVPNASIGTFGIGVMFYAADKISVSAIGTPAGADSLYYVPSGDTRWYLYSADGTSIQLTDIRYKRIA